jgi:xylan 1,4-beta-xylosidase
MSAPSITRWRERFAALAALVAVLGGVDLGEVAAAQPEARITRYRNPVIPGFHPDPSVTRVGEDYYLVNSSFEFFPGVPVFHSRDLVHWRPIGYALTRDSQLPLQGARASGGVFAPTIRYHQGTFYMITTNVTGGGNFFVTARDPAGPWSEPVWIRGQGGIDPSLFFDEDGTVYLQSTGGAPGAGGERGIHQSTIDVATGELLSQPRLIWSGTGGRYPEGPHLYRIRGRYYLMISEGGTEYGHMVTIARSESPWGPFEACPHNPILTHRDTQMDQPVQGTGHADLIQDHEGHWWMVFLGFRPVGGGYWHHLGRETFLAPVTWSDDEWPVVNGGEPVGLETEAEGLPAHPFPPEPTRDDFDGPLGLVWNHLRNPDRSRYSTRERMGWLSLTGTSTTLSEEASPTFVGRRQEHLSARIATRVDFVPSGEGEEAGLTLYQHPLYHYDLGVRRAEGGREVFLRQTVGPSLSAVTASARLREEGPVVLQVTATPTEYTFLWGMSEDRLYRLGTGAARLLSSEVAGGFVGTYAGLYAVDPADSGKSVARFDWFDYEPRTETEEHAPGDGGWQSLFDGRTLGGWHVAARPADQGRGFWSVRDGAITADSRGRKDHDYVWLVSDAEYGDFELALQVRGFPESSGNSGIQVRSRYDDALGWMHGPQVDVHPPAPWRTGLIYDETRETRRWIFPSLEDWRIEPAQGPKEWSWHSPDEGDGWNDVRIVARGPRLRTVVNGVVIADFDGAGVLDDAAHRRHRVGLRGHLALQLHAHDELLIQYRNIRIRPGPTRAGDR